MLKRRANCPMQIGKDIHCVLEDTIRKFGNLIIIASTLREIFNQFPKGAKQDHRFMKHLGKTPLHLAAKESLSSCITCFSHLRKLT